jgi:hypothetical protein
MIRSLAPSIFKLATLLAMTAPAFAQDPFAPTSNPFGEQNLIGKYRLVCVDSSLASKYNKDFWRTQLDWSKIPNAEIPAVVTGIIYQYRTTGVSSVTNKPYSQDSFKTLAAIYEPKLFGGEERVVAKMEPDWFTVQTGTRLEFSFRIPKKGKTAAPVEIGNLFGTSDANSYYGHAVLQFDARKEADLAPSRISVVDGAYELAHQVYCNATPIKAK